MNRIAIACAGVRRPAWTKACERFCLAVLSRLGKTDWEVSLLFCDDETIRDLNARYRKLDRPTDVLSFPQTDGSLVSAHGDARTAGDVVVSLPTLSAHAAEFGVSEDEELKRLLVHGLLHLAGRDHAGNGADEPMLAEQEAILRELGARSILRPRARRGPKTRASGRKPARRTAGAAARSPNKTRPQNRAQKRRK